MIIYLSQVDHFNQEILNYVKELPKIKPYVF